MSFLVCESALARHLKNTVIKREISSKLLILSVLCY